MYLILLLILILLIGYFTMDHFTDSKYEQNQIENNKNYSKYIFGTESLCDTCDCGKFS